MRTTHIRAGLVSAAMLVMAAPTGLRAQAPTETLLRPFEWRTIGPANMGGRITDIEAVEAKPSIVYVATASDGSFKSENGGKTWARSPSTEAAPSSCPTTSTRPSTTPSAWTRATRTGSATA